MVRKKTKTNIEIETKTKVRRPHEAMDRCLSLNRTQLNFADASRFLKGDGASTTEKYLFVSIPANCQPRFEPANEKNIGKRENIN